MASVGFGSKSSAPAEDHGDPINSGNRPDRVRRRVASVYDAVAGRVTLSESLKIPGDERSSSRDRVGLSIDHHTSRDTRLPPDQVLFGRKHAPERFAERDIYFANEALSENGRRVLPSGDLLAATHYYSSNFYEALALRRGSEKMLSDKLIDERSMDETALVAFGILLEEASRHALGKRGDLVFTEGTDENQETASISTSATDSMAGARRTRKRRKLGNSLDSEGRTD